jgi:hypothetical protein
MRYLIAGILVLAAAINLNLIRVGIETGKVQSRMFGYEKDSEPRKFWTAIVIQGFVSCLLFALAALRLSVD